MGPKSEVKDVRHILYIDAYDSFTRNVIDLIESTLDVVVTVVRIDSRWPEDRDAFIAGFDAIVAGPGPGTPTNPNDVGVMNDLWELDNVPVLGVCLGFQSLCVKYGASIRKLPEPRHGRVVTFTHSGTDIFENLPSSFNVTLYHSLQVDLQHELEASGDLSDRQLCWSSSAKCPDLVPLAWYRDSATPAEANLMAVRHRTKPLWGVQFHPESCKSDAACHDMIKNWWTSVVDYNSQFRKISKRPFKICDPLSSGDSIYGPADEILEWCSSSISTSSYRTFDRGYLTTEKICELVDTPEAPCVILDSNSRYSIISVLSPGSWSLEYLLSPRKATYSRLFGLKSSKHFNQEPAEIWELLRRILSQKKVLAGCSSVPFWGGFMGYFSYEMGLAGLDAGAVPKIPGNDGTADIGLLWVERSIVIDQKAQRIHVQSMREFDEQPGEWMELITKRLLGFTYTKSLSPIMLNLAVTSNHQVEDSTYLLRMKYSDEQLANMMVKGAKIIMPDERVYKAKIAKCQEYIRDGESYELCLTDQTKVVLPRCKYRQETALRPWILYKRLRKYTPAAYGAFARIGSASIISSSPECFLQYDRNCQIDMKPMKGTVKKGEGMTLERAKEILNTPKEMGENLMIADLVRHDMFNVCKSGGVTVHKLLEVEDHARVYQLVTQIRGIPQILPPAVRDCATVQLREKNTPHDYSALRHCLPPGSMTGAPKKRSCELLQKIEGEKRGIYSGVMGYFDAGGRACFSVLIRTAYSWGSPTDNEEVWRIGAGGAVTALSTPEGEWDEMVTKLDTVLGIFRSSEEGDEDGDGDGGAAEDAADICQRKKKSVMQDMFRDYPGYTADPNCAAASKRSCNG
ncbi:aminodeoxychorismate synthase [Emergomyces pasteurianus Ep9510]|uniref:aminodeoxychorismate synthase n=1 Tax=Emergomyces pasteurianus Ep9510 TaxID=1447872 RepID=A0A1J9PNT0_9EURO|nr:aminodeoxychorismate synthase [Emergomyces pasteurianus Ep9510]